MFSHIEADGKPMQDPNFEIWEPVALLDLLRLVFWFQEMNWDVL